MNYGALDERDLSKLELVLVSTRHTSSNTEDAYIYLYILSLYLTQNIKLIIIRLHNIY